MKQAGNANVIQNSISDSKLFLLQVETEKFQYFECYGVVAIYTTNLGLIKTRKVNETPFLYKQKFRFPVE